MLRVLLVEDDPTIARALGRLVARHADVVDVVADVATAIARLEVERVDVVITDYQLGPGGTGLALAASIRASWPHVVVVLHSSSLDDQVRASAAALGVALCIDKPASSIELVAALRAIRVARDAALDVDAAS